MNSHYKIFTYSKECICQKKYFSDVECFRQINIKDTVYLITTCLNIFTFIPDRPTRDDLYISILHLRIFMAVCQPVNVGQMLYLILMCRENSLYFYKLI